MCQNCERYLDNSEMEIVFCPDCGTFYMMNNSVFHPCKLKKDNKGHIIAFIEGKEIKLDSKEKEVIKSLEIIRLALPFSGVLRKGEKPLVRVAMPFPGTEALLFN
jgi:hypothetical protein